MENLETIEVRVKKVERDLDCKASTNSVEEKFDHVNTKLATNKELSEEAKKIALSAKNHVCGKETSIEQMEKSIMEHRETMASISKANVALAIEMGKWRWFRGALFPIAIALFATAAGAYTTFINVQRDVENVVEKQEDSEVEVESIAKVQRDLMVVVKKREQESAKTDENMKTIGKVLGQIAENTNPNKKKKGKR